MGIYQRNNIEFRIVSSSAISQFKNLQASSFYQLARKELDFDESAKEVVLLSFDRLSQWLTRIERVCLSHFHNKNGQTIEYLTETILASFLDEQNVMMGVVETHPNIFDNRCQRFVKLIQLYTSLIFAAALRSKAHRGIDELFIFVVDLVSEYLQHMLLCMHEYNNNVIKKTTPAFITISDFSLRTLYVNSSCTPWVDRANFFRTLDTSFSSVVLKYYAESTSEEETFRAVAEKLEKTGIQVQQEQNFTAQE